VGPAADAQLQQQWQQELQALQSLKAGHEPRISGLKAGQEPHNIAVGPASIPVPFGRRLWVPLAVRVADAATRSSDGEGQQLAAARFTCEQLCGQQGSRQSLAAAGALSANDMFALVACCRGGAIFLQGVPQLQPSQRDEVSAAVLA
jgi:hypothetical protein